VTTEELISHKIKIVIYANQTLRAAHASISRLLKQMINAKSMNATNEKLSSIEEIFRLQKTYDLEKQEKELEQKFKKLGYSN